jgi:hypothetical protein
MAELVNLRQARKRRDRTDAAKQAEANRLKFGRTKAERDLKSAEQRRAEVDLNSKKIDR